MSDVPRCAEPHNQGDEWGTVAGGLPSHESLAGWIDEIRVAGTAPNGGRPAVPPSPEAPAELADHPRYRVVQALGKGGMGAVYQAEHRVMKRAVALKVIASHLIAQPEAVERFRREVEAAARLSHPNIVTAYDAEQVGGCHFLVMELVDGVSLNRLVEQTGPFPAARACEFVRQAAVGLEHAHAHGMVHRDIKPHNLMLTRGGQVKILDFGLTRFADDNPSAAPLTHWSCLTGTPDYIAPEQAANAHQADIRADIYGLGCTLYYLLTGRPPFPEGGVFEKVAAHMKEEPTPVANLRKDLAPDLIAVIERMMAKNPDRRFQTPTETARALQAFCSGSALADLTEEGKPFSSFLAASRSTEGSLTRPGAVAPSGGSRTLPAVPRAEKTVDAKSQTQQGTPSGAPSRLSELTVGLIVLAGFGVGGAFGLLALFRPDPLSDNPDRANAVVRSKAPSKPATAEDANREAVVVPIVTAAKKAREAPVVPDPGKAAVANKGAAPPSKPPPADSPVKTKAVVKSKHFATSPRPAPSPPGRGQVVVRSKDQNLEVAIRRRGIVVMTIRPSMGLKDLPAGDYEALVVSGPAPLQGFSTRLSVAHGGRVALDVRPEGILVGDAALLPPPPPSEQPNGSPPPPPTGPPGRRGR